jgi:hypothetical protein
MPKYSLVSAITLSNPAKDAFASLSFCNIDRAYPLALTVNTAVKRPGRNLCKSTGGIAACGGMFTARNLASCRHLDAGAEMPELKNLQQFW